MGLRSRSRSRRCTFPITAFRLTLRRAGVGEQLSKRGVRSLVRIEPLRVLRDERCELALGDAKGIVAIYINP
jgi:hypothetical protein